MNDGNEMFQHLPFPFEDGQFPSTLGAVVQKTVLSGQQPAREVIHAPDGSWLVGDGVNDPNLAGASIATHIEPPRVQWRLGSLVSSVVDAVI